MYHAGVPNGLTVRQERAARIIANDSHTSQTDLARKAGFSGPGAHVRGSELVRNRKVLDRAQVLASHRRDKLREIKSLGEDAVVDALQPLAACETCGRSGRDPVLGLAAIKTVHEIGEGEAEAPPDRGKAIYDIVRVRQWAYLSGVRHALAGYASVARVLAAYEGPGTRDSPAIIDVSMSPPTEQISATEEIPVSESSSLPESEAGDAGRSE